jgi:glycosyltransferase involved in cell wall biosynthesis
MESISVVQVATGMIQIPPNGWGAVERIIWAYKNRLERMNHWVDIRYINHVEKKEGLIVHTHIANLALECRDKGIPYVFSLHDHHCVHYGKGSWVYNQNLAAIKGSIISFTHAEFLVDYFDDTDKLFYLSHGVDTEFFVPAEQPPPQHKLLMLANNGLAGDSTFDRKGFRYGIEAAKRLDLPITVVGTDNNLNFFEGNQDLIAYEKLNIVADNPEDSRTLELYQTHTIFLHPSMLEAGHPNLTLLEAAACALPIVGTYNGSKEIKGLHKLHNISTEAVVDGIFYQMHNYENARKEMLEVRKGYDWHYICEKLSFFYEKALKVTEKYSSEKTKQLYIKAYNETIKNENHILSHR